MTRKTLFNDDQKSFIADSIRTKTHTVTQLANHFSCHPKTINRVMAELGVTTNRGNKTALSTAASDTQRVKKLLKDANISVDQLSQIVITLMAARLTNPDQLQKALLVRTSITASTQAAKARQAALFRPDAQASQPIAHVSV